MVRVLASVNLESGAPSNKAVVLELSTSAPFKFKMQQRAPAIPKQTPASPEDEFDASVLCMSGPWPSSSSAKPPAENPPPLVFNGVDTYVRAFRPLLIEECRAMLITKFEDEAAKSHEKRPSFFLRVYNSAPNDLFGYVEVSNDAALEHGQIVFIQRSGVTKFISIVNAVTKMSTILRVTAKCGITNGQFELWPVDNLTTVKRTYIAMCSLSSFSSPIRRQILYPTCNLDSLLWLKNPQQCNAALMEWSSWMELAKFNCQQMLGIIATLRLQQGFLLIQGPPGTGKTTTIVGIVSAVLAEKPHAKILLSAPSNAALDEAGARLMKGMINRDGSSYVPREGTIVRIGPKGSISNSCYQISVDGILSSRKFIGSWREEEEQLVKNASVICTTLSCCGHWLVDELKLEFDLAIIDEAVQAVETEALIALQRVKNRCVLIGDPCQLPATVFQHPADSYRRSLFERMQEAGVPPHLLDTQYRMHEDISRFPSQHFYGGALKDSAAVRSIFKQGLLGQVIASEGYYFRLCEYSFLDLKTGIDEVDGRGRSRYNDNEARAVISVVRGVLGNVEKSTKLEMGIVTPYSSQKSLIWSRLTADEKRVCEINTIDGFQGREKDVILVSCVRAQEGRGLGFVSDKRRLNVALTRAKFGLFIVGHAQALTQASSDWKALIEDARHRGMYQVLSTVHPGKLDGRVEGGPGITRSPHGCASPRKLGRLSRDVRPGITMSPRGSARQKPQMDHRKHVQQSRKLKEDGEARRCENMKENAVANPEMLEKMHAESDRLEGKKRHRDEAELGKQADEEKTKEPKKPMVAPLEAVVNRTASKATLRRKALRQKAKKQ